MAIRMPEPDISEELASEFGANASYVAELLSRFRTNPSSVDDEWRRYFRERFGEPAPAPAAPPEPARPMPSVAAHAPAPARAAAPIEGERIPIRGGALRIAENMAASLEVPTATTQRQVPVKLVDENRRLVNDYRAATGQSKVSFTHLISWAIIQALKAFPGMNDAFDASGPEPARVRRDRVNFGLAVDVTKGDGSRTLLVPNVKGVEAMTFAEFAAAADDVVTRARTGKIKLSDFEGTTISLTNPGTLGTTASVPRLMAGQGAIIATGAIEYPAEFSAMAPATLSRLAISKVVTFTSTYDHRIIQGAESGAFLARVEELLLGRHGFYEGVFADLAIPFRPFRWEPDRNPPLLADGHTDEIAKQARVLELINAYRVRGHLIADIDPLRSRSIAHHPELDLETHGLTIWDLDREFWTGGLKGGDRLPLREIVAVMRRVYCGKIGTEYRHISSPDEKYWVRERIAAATAGDPPLPAELRRALLVKLIAAEEFERFLGTKFLGQRRYSVEGVDTTIPLLDRLVEGAAARAIDEVVIGMSHRGRLNILANVVGNSAERIFSGFEGVVHPDFPADEGDVKYHQGAKTVRRSESGRDIAVQVESNPSHLEAVDAVVEGVARAKQERTAGHGPQAWKRVLPVLLHGDAAFAGQGMVAEVLNLAQLPGYRTGGTIHVVVNNQIGFTTPPSKGRSSEYSTDVAKINQVPIFHVNADDPEAAYRVLEIALDYRQKFHKDVVIDLIGFRRHGHNEGDEPTYTQPVMYRAIEAHPGVRTLYARRLVREGVLTEAQVQELEAKQLAEYEAALEAAKKAAQRARPAVPAPSGSDTGVVELETGVPRETLSRIGRVLTTVPSGFHLNPKMVQQLARRGKMAEGALPLDWGTAEALAFGSLLLEGTPIRVSGQDSARGTFSHRHALLYDSVTGEAWGPLATLDPKQAPFEVSDSPLSEFAVLGFEYGYSVEWPEALVLWEAQFGDFANGAQVIVDQFVASAEDKWRQTTRMGMLLPHGSEGQGPEHSSARIERYLQLGAEGNMQVVNATTPAQYFHLLRRQMRQPQAKPLVLFSPKSLLRLPAAASPLDALTRGGFRAVLDDPEVSDRGAVERVLFCSGKVYYDLRAERERRGDRRVGVVRVEQLYPFPEARLSEIAAGYPRLSDAVWVQEEPRNMGAWSFVRERSAGFLGPDRTLRYVGRAASPSPATGNAGVHKRELEQFLAEAFAV
ncbi:MAG TPA: multifunctional oxoglutarate decarboxylase/oxoglutarate dehydrogenase thiamine pyrophosphate-binding subunit/dihydrolipoyllysine-residue succinyltransferase subunit [Thermoanaerobaculia bacterium]|nr:multifunctional oxoglutarate decarboxylase/oxoglutarate dehydrogenase thiamine pyrophosphate-binding subunit/dihydrolipoyllysine-residue succinyltransferase subunit [Thermoanaerobaculia bacterium]